MNNRFQKIKEWLKDCPYLSGYTYFNVVPDLVGANAITSDANISGVVAEYSDGSKEIELLFNIYAVCDYDKGTSDVNLEAAELFEKITEWIKYQDKHNNYPDFNNSVVHSIEAVYTNPDVFLDETQTKSQYEAKYKISYLEKRS